MRHYSLNSRVKQADDKFLERQKANPPNKVTEDDICSVGKRNGKRMGDVEVWFWVFCWNKFLHKSPEKPESQYIIQHIDQLDKETDEMFVPDPRKFK